MRLVNNASGTAANNDVTGNPADIKYNRDPNFVQNNLLTTLYFWATAWGGASVQIYLCPQTSREVAGGENPVWFVPPGIGPVTANGMLTFQHRWGGMKAVVTNASGQTSELFVSLFSPS